MLSNFSYLRSIKIQGYRPFRDFLARFEPLEVIVGANGSGKSSLFEFLKFLTTACLMEIPPEIIEGSIGQQIFHKPGPDKFSWSAEVLMQKFKLFYQGELMGPVGAAKVLRERVRDSSLTFLDFKDGKGLVTDPSLRDFKRKEWDLKKPNQLALGAITDSTLATLFNLREYIRGWRFYDSFNINNEKIRRPVPDGPKKAANILILGLSVYRT